MTNRDVFAVCWARYKVTRASLDGIVPPDEVDPSSRGDRHLVTNAEYNADFEKAGERALPLSRWQQGNRMRRLYELYVKQQWEWKQAVGLMGAREDVVAAWWEEVQDRVGQELRDRRIWPLKAYFTEPSDGGKLPAHPRVSL